MANEEDLIDYSDEEVIIPPTTGPAAAQPAGASAATDGVAGSGPADAGIDGYAAGVHSASFRDFLLKQELTTAIADCGFEHPSRVQHETIPQAILGTDILCQAKSGLGKTAVFVIAVLQQLVPVDGEVSAVVVCHTRELAFQIKSEFGRFAKYMPDVRYEHFFGGYPIQGQIDILSNPKTRPHIVVATPGRLWALVENNHLQLGNVKMFVVDECDRVLEQVDMRQSVQQVFRNTPLNKQVMMFTATLPGDTKAICRKFLRNPHEIIVGDESSLSLHGLKLFYTRLTEEQKNLRLNQILDAIQFNQVIIFVRSTHRATELERLLLASNFPCVSVHSGVNQEERIRRFEDFKQFKKRICVATDVFGRGIDLERVNLVVNYDMPTNGSSFLHRVGRAGRFGTKGLAISFLSTTTDDEVFNEVKKRFEIDISEFPADDKVDASLYMDK